MKLYNKGHRAFIIKKSDALEGCRFPEDMMLKNKAYIDPDTEVEVSDEVGTKLLANYPTELKEMKPSTRNRIKDNVEKKAKKIKPGR